MTYAVVNNQYRFAHWKQLDGHPYSLGLELLRFLQSLPASKLKSLAKRLDRYRPFCPSLKDNGSNILLQVYGPHHSAVDIFSDLLDRKLGAIIEMDDCGVFPPNRQAICEPGVEFVYVIDFDQRAFEVIDSHDDELTLIASYPLDDLPYKWDFLRDYFRFLDFQEEVPPGHYRKYLFPDEMEPFTQMVIKSGRMKAA